MCVTAKFGPIFHRLGGLLANASSRWATPRLQKRPLKALSDVTIGTIPPCASLICGPFGRGVRQDFPVSFEPAAPLYAFRARRGSFRLSSGPRKRADTFPNVARATPRGAGRVLPHPARHMPRRMDFPLIRTLASVMLLTSRLEIRYGRPLHGRQTPSHQRQPQGQDR